MTKARALSAVAQVERPGPRPPGMTSPSLRDDGVADEHALLRLTSDYAVQRGTGDSRSGDEDGLHERGTASRARCA